jgi:hypothetical protein
MIEEVFVAAEVVASEAIEEVSRERVLEDVMIVKRKCTVQHVLTVVNHVKCHFAQQTASQYTVVTVLEK